MTSYLNTYLSIKKMVDNLPDKLKMGTVAGHLTFNEDYELLYYNDFETLEDGVKMCNKTNADNEELDDELNDNNKQNIQMFNTGCISSCVNTENNGYCITYHTASRKDILYNKKQLPANGKKLLELCKQSTFGDFTARSILNETI